MLTEMRLTLAVALRLLQQTALPLTILRLTFLLSRQQVREFLDSLGPNRNRVSVLVWVLRLMNMGMSNVPSNLLTKPTRS